MTSRLRLKVTAGNAAGTEIEVEDEFLIGRGEAGPGTLGDDVEISRRHARISRPDDNYVIEDLGSTNGTHLNGHQVRQPEVLSVGDRVELGQTTLVVQYTAPEEAPAEAPAQDSSKTAPRFQPGAPLPESQEPPPGPPPPMAEPAPPVAETPPPVADAPPPMAEPGKETEPLEPEPLEPEPLEADVFAPSQLPGRLGLRLEVDFEPGEVRIQLDGESEPIRLVWEDGRWRPAPPA